MVTFPISDSEMASFPISHSEMVTLRQVHIITGYIKRLQSPSMLPQSSFRQSRGQIGVTRVYLAVHRAGRRRFQLFDYFGQVTHRVTVINRDLSDSMSHLVGKHFILKKSPKIKIVTVT